MIQALKGQFTPKSKTQICAIYPTVFLKTQQFPCTERRVHLLTGDRLMMALNVNMNCFPPWIMSGPSAW